MLESLYTLREWLKIMDLSLSYCETVGIQNIDFLVILYISNLINLAKKLC